MDQVAGFVEERLGRGVTMRLADFGSMVRRLSDEVPPEFLDGVAEIDGLAPDRAPSRAAGICTLGECIPFPAAMADPPRPYRAGSCSTTGPSPRSRI